MIVGGCSQDDDTEPRNADLYGQEAPDVAVHEGLHEYVYFLATRRDQIQRKKGIETAQEEDGKGQIQVVRVIPVDEGPAFFLDPASTSTSWSEASIYERPQGVATPVAR